MSSFKILQSRLDKIRAQIPHKTGRHDISHYTAQELDEKLYQLKLEKAISEGDTAEAERLRRRHSVTLEQLKEKFLSLDISQLPPPSDRIPIQENGITYSISQTEYRHLYTCIAIRGASAYRDDIWRWVEYFSSCNLGN